MMRPIVLLTLLTLVACATGREDAQVRGERDENAGLSGTAWQLSVIQFMDDSALVPDEASKYTLTFGADGRAALRADCNRGSGAWQSESPGQLTFGPIAATRAMCPPGSIADEYLAQFQWVRSYVLREGHLFLATMADGAIIEFEPVTATPQ